LLEVALAEANIPFRTFGGLKLMEASHVKDVIALLRLLCNPRDALSWFRVLAWCDGLGPKTAEALTAEITALEPPRLDPARHKGRKFGADLAALAGEIERLQALVEDVVAVVEAATAAHIERMPRLYEDWKRRVKDLESLPLIATRHAALDELLAELALDPVEQRDLDAADPSPGPDELLTLSTVHSAKGLEWDAVIVLQVVDGAFPSAWSLDDPEQIEEERRLFYVAVTRARRHLWLMQPQFTHSRFGTWTSPGCSLLDDLPGVDRIAPHQRPARSAAVAKPVEVDPAEIEAQIDRMRRFFNT
jgi:DNA helicase-2/ATP-dependent DNA helicase PcrA